MHRFNDMLQSGGGHTAQDIGSAPGSCDAADDAWHKREKDGEDMGSMGIKVGLAWGCLLAVLAVGASEVRAESRQFCRQYASTTADVVRDAISKNPACQDYHRGVHDNYDMHFNWCIHNSRDTVMGATDHIRSLAAPAGPGVYARHNAWVIRKDYPGICSAEIIDRSKGQYLGELLRFQFSSGDFRIVSDYTGGGDFTHILVDGQAFPAHFAHESDAVVARIDRNLVSALKRGSVLNLNFDPTGPQYSLSGSSAAIDLMTQCARGQNPSPQPAPASAGPNVIHGACKLMVDGRMLLDIRQDCPIWMANDGTGTFWVNTDRDVYLDDYFAEVKPSGNGLASGHWNGERGATHAQAWPGDDIRLGNGGCWSNACATICA
ncbi:MAG: hypothetical protein MnENMB40S_29580 [Rhizobiaceae bacterium MnEN-MB40S]|nr:MAG: hypothetical protein MnENMB40S_29580 [Rhizobiaceae bacterium MnEN-MB40S]